MESSSVIPDKIQANLPSIIAAWREARRGDLQDESYAQLAGCMEQLTMMFTEFLRSPQSLEGYSRGGATRSMIGRVARYQHDLGRDAVGVIDDFMVLRRCIWRSVEKGTDLSALSGGEVARFFVKLMQASDWVTERGLEAFDAIVQEEMEEKLGRAQATDLITGLPDRDIFNRLLLPRALGSHDRLALAVFDVAHFTETVASGRVEDARRILHRLAQIIRDSAPEDAVCARFGDDEISVILPGEGAETAYRMAERVLQRLTEDQEEVEVDAGVAEYPAHGRNAGDLVSETLKALNMAKRVGGSGIVAAR